MAKSKTADMATKSIKLTITIPCIQPNDPDDPLTVEDVLARTPKGIKVCTLGKPWYGENKFYLSDWSVELIDDEDT